MIPQPRKKLSEQININAIVPSVKRDESRQTTLFANFMQQIYDATTFHILHTKLQTYRKKTTFTKRKRGGWMERAHACNKNIEISG